MWNLLTLNGRCDAFQYNTIFDKMASFINVFTKSLSKTWRKRCHILTQNFKIHFNMCVLLRHHVFLYLKFYLPFCFCHHSLFNVSLFYLFINVFTRYLTKTWLKTCHILTQNSNVQFNMYVFCITMCFYI